MTRVILVIIPIIMSAAAQVILKFSTRYEARSFVFIALLFVAICFYTISFLGYSFALRFNDISKLSPIMAVSVMIIIVVTGALWFNEKITIVNWFGLLLGGISLVLIAI